VTGAYKYCYIRRMLHDIMTINNIIKHPSVAVVEEHTVRETAKCSSTRARRLDRITVIRSHVCVPYAFGQRVRPRAVAEAHRWAGLQWQWQNVPCQACDLQLVARHVPELQRYDASVGRLARVFASGFACNYCQYSKHTRAHEIRFVTVDGGSRYCYIIL